MKITRAFLGDVEDDVHQELDYYSRHIKYSLIIWQGLRQANVNSPSFGLAMGKFMAVENRKSLCIGSVRTSVPGISYIRPLYVLDFRSSCYCLLNIQTFSRRNFFELVVAVSRARLHRSSHLP